MTSSRNGAEIIHFVPRQEDVPAISRQYALGPMVYAATVAIAWFSATACLIASAAIAVYFALPPRLWRAA